LLKLLYGLDTPTTIKLINPRLTLEFNRR